MVDDIEYDQPLMGVAEVAQYFAVSRQVVSNWHARGKMPKPVVKLRMGPIWLTEDIEEYHRICNLNPE